VEDLKFDLVDDACLVEYEAENASHCSEPVCMLDDAPLVDTLVDHFHVECSEGNAHVLAQQQYDSKVAV